MCVQGAGIKLVSKEPVMDQRSVAVARVLPKIHLHARRVLLAVEVDNALFQKSFPDYNIFFMHIDRFLLKRDNCEILLVINTS